jgi:hypothetical protein
MHSLTHHRTQKHPDSRPRTPREYTPNTRNFKHAAQQPQILHLLEVSQEASPDHQVGQRAKDEDEDEPQNVVAEDGEGDYEGAGEG